MDKFIKWASQNIFPIIYFIFLCYFVTNLFFYNYYLAHFIFLFFVVLNNCLNRPRNSFYGLCIIIDHKSFYLPPSSFWRFKPPGTPTKSFYELLFYTNGKNFSRGEKFVRGFSIQLVSYLRSLNILLVVIFLLSQFSSDISQYAIPFKVFWSPDFKQLI